MEQVLVEMRKGGGLEAVAVVSSGAAADRLMGWARRGGAPAWLLSREGAVRLGAMPAARDEAVRS